MKSLFLTAPIHFYFAPERQTVVETDASDILGCVLSQLRDKRLHLVTFDSTKFNSAKLNYEMHKKELLAIITAFKEWKHYFESSKLSAIVYTNHENLEYLMKTLVILIHDKSAGLNLWLV